MYTRYSSIFQASRTSRPPPQISQVDHTWTIGSPRSLQNLQHCKHGRSGGVQWVQMYHRVRISIKFAPFADFRFCCHTHFHQNAIEYVISRLINSKISPLYHPKPENEATLKSAPRSENPGYVYMPARGSSVRIFLNGRFVSVCICS